MYAVKKPVTIEAFQFDPSKENCGIPTSWVIDGDFDFSENNAFMIIPTLEGNHKAMPGDFIIKGVNGEFYPCKPDIFMKTYTITN